MENVFFEQIGPYLAGKLNKQEKELFEVELSNNKALMEELEFHQNLQNARSYQKSLSYFREIKADLENEQSNKKKLIPFTYRTRLVAAGIAFMMLTTIIWYLFRPSTISVDPAFRDSELAVIQKGLISNNSRGDIDSVKNIIDRYMQNENFELASSYLDSIIKINHDSYFISYRSFIYLKRNEILKANLLLKDSFEKGDVNTKCEIGWLYFLSYIELEKTTEHKQIAKKLLDIGCWEGNADRKKKEALMSIWELN